MRSAIKNATKTLAPAPLLKLLRYSRVRWLDRHGEAKLRAKTLRNAAGRGATLSFYPGRPRPSNVIREIAAELGMQVRRSRSGDAVFFWPTDEGCFPPQPAGRINHRCLNIDKDMVDRAFAEAAGYSITIDPRTYTGPYVRKSTTNAAHDGAVLTGPSEPQPGCVYQRLIDNVFGDEIEEIRAIYMRGVLDFVYLKRRPIADRFLVPNKSVKVMPTASILSPSEVEVIEGTAQRLGLECGEIDVLRDNGEGRIYVIDVNRTPNGPPAIFSAEQTQDVVRRLASEFRKAFLAPAASTATYSSASGPSHLTSPASEAMDATSADGL